MKFKLIYLLALFVVLIGISINVIEVNAMNTGFSTEEKSEEKKNTFISNINIVPLKDEPEKKGIQCFDVNEQGMIAIGQENFCGNGKEVCVYTTQGEFLYGYAFDCYGSFGVEWDNELINIFFIRSDVIISLDSDGNVLDVKTVQETLDNNSYRNSLRSTTRTAGNTKYIIRNDMGIFNWIAVSYSQIVTIDDTGTESIIYDVNSTQFIKTIIIVILVCAFASVCITVIVRQHLKLRSGNYPYKSDRKQLDLT